MPKRLTGINPLSYRGVEAVQPPNIVESSGVTVRQPTTSDYYEYNEGDLWMVKRAATDAIPNELWYLARKTGTTLGVQADWRQLYPGTGGGGGGNLRSDDTLISVPDPITGAINVYGGNAYAPGSDIRLGDPAYVNIYTVQFPDINTLEVVLKRSINQPLTNQTATEGMYSLGGTNFMHNFANTALGGDHNTWLGHNAGNLTMTTAAENVGIGYNALRDTAMAAFCTAVGSNALANVDDGQYCIGIGHNAGVNLDFADSDDIMIGNDGVLGDLSTIRIGQMPTPNPLVPPGPGEQNRVFIAGIWNSPAVPLINTGLVIVDDSGELYVDDLEPNSVVMTNAGGNPIAVKGPVGTVLTGHGILPVDPSPEFLPVESAGGTVTISTNPITGAINLEAAGVAGLVTLTSDLGVVLPLLGNINVLGGDLINTDNLIANTVTVNLDRSTQAPAVHCEIVTGMGPAAASIYKELWSSDGSILFDLVSDPAKIDITAPGGGGGALTNLKDMNDIACLPVAGVIKIDAGDNIETTTMAPGILEVRVTDNVDLAGWLHAALEVQAGTDLISVAGNLRLAQTNNTGTQGVISFGGNRYIHQFGDTAGKKNFFAGYRSGNITMTPAVAIGNTGLGYATVEALTTGTYNSGLGYAACSDVTTGTYNTGCGEGALQRLTTGSFNVGLGRRGGYNYTGNEYSNICIEAVGVLGDRNKLRIGTHGTGDAQQSDCYIAGIRGAAAGTSPEMVVIGTVASGYKVWSQAIPSAGASIYSTDSGSAAPSAGTIQIKGGDNIHTTGATNIVTVHLDHSIMQPMTDLSAGGIGFYSLFAAGSTAYTTYRFMHAYGTSCAYLGLGAGSISLGVTSCVGIGANSMPILFGGAFNNNAIGKDSMKVATTAKNCICLGTSSGGVLTSATADILIGTTAGVNYDTESYNIIIGGSAGSTAGDASIAGDTRKMYLGYKQVINPATGAITTNGTNDTYVYGIYNRPVASSAAPVYVDHLGKLGTGGGAAFSFVLTSNLSNLTGDGTSYAIGSNGFIGIEFDETGAIAIGGGGIPTKFVTPFAGRYKFSATVTYIIPGTMPPPVLPRLIDPLYMYVHTVDPSVPQKSKMFTAYLPNPVVGTDQYVSEIVTALVELEVGDTVQWTCKTSGGTKRIGLLATETLFGPWATYFSGHRVG